MPNHECFQTLLRIFPAILVAGLSATAIAARPSGTLVSAQASTPPASAAAAPASEWPQVTTQGGEQITVYQPQFESLDGITLQMSAAVTITRTSQGSSTGGTALNGIANLTAQAVPADVPGELEVHTMTVQNVTFGSTADDSVALALNTALKGLAFTVDRQTLVQDMAIANARAAGTPGLSFTPPKFVDSNVAATLITIDGAPILVPAGNDGWKSVKNSAFVVLQSPEGKWFVQVGAGAGGPGSWMSSLTLNGTYAADSAPPASAVAALGTAKSAPDATGGAQPSSATSTGEVPARIIVATEPTVLIAIAGTPNLVAAAPGVREVTNANCVLLKVDSPSEWWTLQSGRWFHAAPGTPWQYASPAQVPASFQNLAVRGRLVAARASVPGTTEAKAAVVAAREVRTITVHPDATCYVSYNGAPNFVPVSGTNSADIGYATNASQPVFGIGNQFYCCNSGAWFVASSTNGPWTVTDTVPDAIYQIPATCPVYAATYVEVYGSEKDPKTGALKSVTFGFSAGYLGTYLNEGTPVYGTGHDYSALQATPATASNYQPAPETYGANALYDGQTGTYAPYAYNADYNYLEPCIQPYYLDNGWGGWGWCPGWSSGWGWGWNNWNRWNSWSGWANNWHPNWNPNWNNEWQHNHRLYANNRATNAQQGYSASNPWGESSDWQKWNAANAAGDEPQNKEPANWQKWNAASAAGDEPQNKEPANWQKWNAASAAGNEPQDRQPVDQPSNFYRNSGYNYGTNRSVWNSGNAAQPRPSSNAYANQNWGTAPRSGVSGFHPSYQQNYRPGPVSRPAASAFHGGSGRR